MITNSDDRHNQYIHRRGDTIHENSGDNEKKDTNDITNRRHSIAHINFRKAIDRSLSLPEVDDDESNNILKRYKKIFMKFCFIGLFIILIGSLIKFLWSFNRHK